MRYVGFVLMAIVCGSFNAAGRGETGEIRGRVVDASGKPLTAATVSVRGGPHGGVEVRTDADGSFALQGLTPGKYVLEARVEGFARQILEGISLAAGGSHRVTVTMTAPATIQAVKGAEERNPNYFISKIDLNAVRDLLRRGIIVPVALEPDPSESAYGAEYGAPLRSLSMVKPGRPPRQLRQSFLYTHQNSALNARPFFNVGSLRPSRRNQIGFTGSGPLPLRNLFFTTALDIVRESGYVNGNVRVPLPNERTPASGDAGTDRILEALLQGFPQEAPNLPNVAERQLNTNALRRIGSLDWSIRLDYAAGARHAAAARYTFSQYSEDPFELVAGQNPKTDLRPQTFSVTDEYAPSPRSVIRTSFYFDRFRALLLPTDRFRSLLEPIGLRDTPDIDFGGEYGADLTPLGPKTEFPRRRFQNRFAGSVGITRSYSAHTMWLGASAVRVQTNDLQSDNTRGRFVFGNNFGRSPVENFLRGTPTKFTITLGDLYRGFRHSEYAAFFGNTFRVRSDLTLTFGTRYEVTTSPSEVNRRTEFPIGTDGNNFAPQVGFAWSVGRRGPVIRGGYGISFGQIFPATYQLARFNPPAVRTVTVQNPSLTNPLKDVDLTQASAQRSELSLLSPDLVTPYTHQYSLLVQKELGSFGLEVGYVGSRTIKLFFPFISNRAEPVPGMEATTGNVNLRRPDAEHLRIQTIINSGIGYYDALKVGVRQRFASGLALEGDYVFSKNLTSGFAFYNTLNREKSMAVNQNNDDFQADVRGPSEIDARHALALNYSWEPHFRGGPVGLLNSWRFSGSTVFRTGNWFNLTTNSDAPGFGNVDGESDDRPNILRPEILGTGFDDPDTSESILNPAFFDSIMPPGGRGNLGMRVFRKHALNNTNFSVSRTFRLNDGVRLQLRSDFYNLFNHPQFERPGDVLPSPVFGKIIDTQNKGRVVQLMARFDF